MSEESKPKPIWVESVLSSEEYRLLARKFPTVFSNGPVAVQFNPTYYTGGKWRASMGSGYNMEEIKLVNNNIDKLFKFLQTLKLPECTT